MWPSRETLVCIAGFLLGTVLLTGGCDNTIDPFSEKGQYSVYGYLSASRDRQVIRVKPLPIPLTEVDSNTLENASVTLRNLTSGNRRALKDSIITFRDEGSRVITHNFWTEASIQPGTEYRLVVEGPRGTTRATATTPKRPEKAVSPQSGDCLDEFRVVLKNFRFRRAWRATIQAKYAGTWHPFPATDAIAVKDNAQTERLMLSFQPETILGSRIPEQSLPEDKNSRCWFAPRCAELESKTIKVRISYLGPNWYGDIPEDSLVYNPLNSFVVTDGLGFFGALGRAQTSVSVDTSEVLFLDRFC